ncbi:MerR family transcriptional regulator [Bradyrhizobium sp. CCGUVB1N3]|uniref:MerR family transcriptional regulator n=1 Tax=Bradyrhizobium sp. CCGUVB1N3 TaxID=2949629 RepID=UPI0020B386F5|nr:MerR family transcriptional regulator [Bradyrhizobium sp. CCGUVB1N3]MCP3475914.1 MerR family transcriptional regulator [Bradyrhizobium sp. CCGUVB1N3]
MTRPTVLRRRWRRIGELADATGVTVRTLRHYEHTGLLAASQRTCGGHRIYDCESLRRVYHILALRELGFSLREIRKAMDGRTSLPDLLSEQLERAELQVARATKLRDRLRNITKNTESDVSVDELPARLDAMSRESCGQPRRRARAPDDADR